MTSVISGIFVTSWTSEVFGVSWVSVTSVVSVTSGVSVTPVNSWRAVGAVDYGKFTIFSLSESSFLISSTLTAFPKGIVF